MEYFQKLKDLDYFKYVHASVLAEKEKIQDTGFYSSWVNRWFMADGEELLEYGVVDYLTELFPALELMGVKSFNIKNIETNRFYAISVNETKYEILSEEDYRSNNWDWGKASFVTMHIINKLLEESGSKERVYVTQQFGGNDMYFVILTPELADFINCTDYKDEPLWDEKNLTDNFPEYKNIL